MNVSGEKKLDKLIGSMHPVLSDQKYVFASLNTDSSVSRTTLIEQLAPLGTFYEKEGLTVIVLKTNADALGISYQGVFQCITLNVHSSLEAVGLTAAVSSALANQDISANVVAAYYHDHIFVPMAKANQALSCLQKMVRDCP
jgi:hypothetical protein